MSHIIGNGMPRGAEAALLASGIMGNDINTRNLGNRIHRDVVVGDTTTLLHGEEAAIADNGSSTPHAVDNGSGVIARHGLLVETGTLTSDHVEENAIAGSIAVTVRMGS